MKTFKGPRSLSLLDACQIDRPSTFPLSETQSSNSHCSSSLRIEVIARKTPSSETSSSKATTTAIGPSKAHVSSTGDKHTDLEQIEVKLEKTTDPSQPNPKHSNPTTNNSGGFSLKNPVSSFRSWVSHKKGSREDSATMNHSNTTYGKIDTTPIPRKSSFGSDTSKRNRTNSASASQTASTTQNHHGDETSSSPATSTRPKKKSSFAFRSANPIALLKRTAETNHQSGSSSGPEQTGTAGGGGGGAFGYFKNLVRGDSSGSEKKQ